MKAIPHVEAVYDNSRRFKTCSCEHRDVNILHSTNVVDDETGRIKRLDKYVKLDTKENVKNLRVADFSLDNLIAVGADLKETSLSMGTLGHLDNAEKQLSKMSNSIK